jgi:DNA-binding helix-hairpin-helix protein with protein kinase domain
VRSEGAAKGPSGQLLAFRPRRSLRSFIIRAEPREGKEDRGDVPPQVGQSGRISAWPIDVLRPSISAPPEGFLMPKIVGYGEAHLLYTPKSRRTHFPDAQLPFIVHASFNIARAFATVHEAGQVIGDVNHANLMIAKDATVRMIDCDSFEITDGRSFFPCLVGVPTYTPPELAGAEFKWIRTTKGRFPLESYPIN